MQKLLVAGGLGVVVVLVLLWHETRARYEPPPTAARAAPAPIEGTALVANVPAPVAPAVATVVPAAAAAPDDGKLSPNSDEFFDRFIERQPKVVSREAMSCYRGHHLGMDQWLRFSFVGHVKHGEVTFSDVQTKESRLDDPALESCMLRAVADAHFHDDSLPDVDSYPDETTLNPERGGKKYLHHADAD